MNEPWNVFIHRFYPHASMSRSRCPSCCLAFAQPVAENNSKQMIDFKNVMHSSSNTVFWILIKHLRYQYMQINSNELRFRHFEAWENSIAMSNEPFHSTTSNLIYITPSHSPWHCMRFKLFWKYNTISITNCRRQRRVGLRHRHDLCSRRRMLICHRFRRQMTF